jgi:sugar lactone lactonase YvrE
VDGFTLLASGYGAIEGPAADDEGGLYFSDVPNGGVFRLPPSARVEVVVPKRKSVGGIIIHADGGIVIAGRDITRVVDGHSEILLSLADVGSHGDTTPAGFNDMCADPQGRIFAGLVRRDAAGEMAGYELVMVEAAGKAVVVDSGDGLPNGAVTSPDGRWLYHADTEAKSIAVLDLDGPGLPKVVHRLSTAHVPGGPDGMAVDVDGGLWLALYQGGYVARLTPDGELDRLIEVPALNALNVCFIGPELEDLIVVTHDNAEHPELGACVFRTSVGIRGIPAGRARV